MKSIKPHLLVSFVVCLTGLSTQAEVVAGDAQRGYALELARASQIAFPNHNVSLQSAAAYWQEQLRYAAPVESPASTEAIRAFFDTSTPLDPSMQKRPDSFKTLNDFTEVERLAALKIAEIENGGAPLEARSNRVLELLKARVATASGDASKKRVFDGMRLVISEIAETNEVNGEVERLNRTIKQIDNLRARVKLNNQTLPVEAEEVKLRERMVQAEQKLTEKIPATRHRIEAANQAHRGTLRSNFAANYTSRTIRVEIQPDGKGGLSRMPRYWAPAKRDSKYLETISKNLKYFQHVKTTIPTLAAGAATALLLSLSQEAEAASGVGTTSSSPTQERYDDSSFGAQ